MPLVGFALTAFAAYAGLVAESKLMVGSLIFFFCCQRLGLRLLPEIDRRQGLAEHRQDLCADYREVIIWNRGNVIYLTRTNGFFALGMELQMYLTAILGDDTFQIDPYLALGYAAMPCLGYFVSSFLVARTIPQVILRHLGHVFGVALIVVCIASLVV